MEVSQIFSGNTYVLKEGAFTTRQIKYCSVDDQLLFHIEDTKRNLLDQILKVIPLYTYLSVLRRSHFIAKAPDSEKPLFHVEKKPGFTHFRIYDECGDFIAQVRSASKWKSTLNVGVYDEHLGTIDGSSNWWTFDSPEGVRYVDYKKDSYLPNYESKNILSGPNVAKISNTPTSTLSIVALAIPYILEIILLNNQS